MLMVNGSKPESNKNGGRENTIAKIKSPVTLIPFVTRENCFFYFTQAGRGCAKKAVLCH
jgi:hypothetical protein